MQKEDWLKQAEECESERKALLAFERENWAFLTKYRELQAKVVPTRQQELADKLQFGDCEYCGRQFYFLPFRIEITKEEAAKCGGKLPTKVIWPCCNACLVRLKQG